MEENRVIAVIEQGTSCGIEVEAREKEVFLFQHGRQAQIHLNNDKILLLIDALFPLVKYEQWKAETPGQQAAQDLLPAGIDKIMNYLDNEFGDCPVKYFFDNEGNTITSMTALIQTVSGFASPLLVKIGEMEAEIVQLKADVDHYARQNQ